ncbi:LacI family DNA-binding transcriptional regulator [Jiangella anatolica]|uniref:LacI family transcriptional regulator n=1 Tax=Jiangella anatolica TaxID=2670374 RepID=A0A2W2B0B5_9ACTN|nr:LacI family DNA-binding transcriptional regulator [Jiangella anatolica]PZF80875.1 LacI family transcriptional regulator [Jiangella anatolica]
MTTARAVTISDVARAAGVSPATVSRVLNGVGTVAPELADRVRKAAADTRYVPNSNGRALRRRVSDVWAVIVSDVQNPFFTGVVAAIERVAVDRGFSVVLCNSDEQVARESEYLRLAAAQHLAGLVIAVASEVESDLRTAADIPAVVIDRRVHDHLGDSVMVDNRLAGRLAADHLLEQGFRRIACITGPSDVSTTEDRLAGFRARLSEAGAPIARKWIRRANLRAEGGEAALRAILRGGDLPDAVFATNGPLTEGAYQALQAEGIAIGAEVGLIGVDDDHWTRMVAPQVSVVQQPVAEIGRLAGELLANRAARGPGPAQQIVLTPTLLARGSTRGH